MVMLPACWFCRWLPPLVNCALPILFVASIRSLNGKLPFRFLLLDLLVKIGLNLEHPRVYLVDILPQLLMYEGYPIVHRQPIGQRPGRRVGIS